MIGIDVNKIMTPAMEIMREMVSKLDRVIDLLEEVSQKLDQK